MKNISKAFFGVTVLSHVDFSVERNEVHALLGENGAGKSTLMNILAGVYTRDAGTIEFDGAPLDQVTVTSSEKAGIAFVHQELNLINDLKVYENIFLRRELVHRFGALNKKEMIGQTHELFSRLGVQIDPTLYVRELDTGKKQLLEIVKALHANAKLLILDEPTTALNGDEIEHLFSIVRRLKAQGTSFIFISHKMNEIFSLADRYTVLRNGQMVACGDIAETTPVDVTRMMVGQSYSEGGVYEPRSLGEPILTLDDLSGEGFEHISLAIKKGEVVGFTGLKGAGISEMMQTLFGALPITGGTLKINGQPVRNHSIHKAMALGLAMIASNRKENSIIPDFTLLENNYVSAHALTRGRPIIRTRQERARFDEIKQSLNIKCNDSGDMITQLSGGNQQKVILGRWLNISPSILLMDNPTQGIDVGAKAEIYKLIQELARSGMTILVNTLEISEVQKVADRCIVFFHGSVAADLARSEITEERVMLSATGALNLAEV